MKKITLITVLLLSVFILSAQQNKGDIELGGNIGVNFSNVVTTDLNGEVFETLTKTSFNIAASGEYYFSDRWGLKAKLIYDKKGWSEDLEIDDFPLDYLSIPLMANWHFGKKRNWYLNFGFYTAFLLDAENDYFPNQDAKDFYKSNDFGLAFGIGVKFPVSENVKLFLEYDAQSGFTDFGKQDEFSIRNGRSALNIGLLFDL